MVASKVARNPAPFQHVRIEALAFELPPHRITSKTVEDDLAQTYKRLGIPTECIETLVGITARRFWDAGTAIDDMLPPVAGDVPGMTRTPPPMPTPGMY